MLFNLIFCNENRTAFEKCIFNVIVNFPLSHSFSFVQIDIDKKRAEKRKLHLCTLYNTNQRFLLIVFFIYFFCKGTNSCKIASPEMRQDFVQNVGNINSRKKLCPFDR